MNIKTLKRWSPLIILAALMAVAFSTGLHEKISLQALQDNKDNLLQAVSNNPIITALGFIAIYIVFVALSLPAATLLTLTGGFLFGTWFGTLYVVSAATVGASVIFFIAKTSLGEVLREKAGKLYSRIEGNMKDNAVGYLLFMRLVPIFPFFLVNIVPALFNVRMRTFVLTTFFGIMPGSFVFVNLGKQLATIENVSDLVSTQTLAAFALLGFFALIPTIYKQIKNKGKTAALILAGLLAFSNSAYAAQNYDKFLFLYDGLLKSYVAPTSSDNINYNGVNYDDWSKDSRHAQALKLLLSEDPKSRTGDAQKAFWINAYNFLTIDLIIREAERDSIKNLGGVFSSPWKSNSWTIYETDYTLDYIENKILRPMGDARIHFAINCASISCPDLRTKAYRGENLNKQLDDQVRITLKNTGKGLLIDGDVIYASKIFDWFSEDFNNGDTKSWIKNFTPINPNAKLKFMNYDWSLNNKQILNAQF